MFARHVSPALVGMLLVMLTGCAGSPHTKFYQLSALSGSAKMPQAASADGNMIVSIGPVIMPDYLERPQIVTRAGKNELDLAEFDQWAGSLRDDINRVLVENIGQILPTDRFFVLRWAPYLDSQGTNAYKVEVRIDRFEGILGEEVLLLTQWGIFDGKRSLLTKKQLGISERMNGSSYDALVAAMSRALEKLSRDIADGIISVDAEGTNK